MTIQSLLGELNDSQKLAATMENRHAIVIAGAGCGKTKTIVARAAFLISNGTPPTRIQILTFTRRAAAEIVNRVRMHLGDSARGLSASTFHSWCMQLIRSAPEAFGCESSTVIDRDDQLQLFRLSRGRSKVKDLPTAKVLCDLYSFARNTRRSLSAALMKFDEALIDQKAVIAEAMKFYEAKKHERHYLDYDDILDIVARRIQTSPETCSWVASHYDHLLVDEMQDTNPLQWELLSPIKEESTLFCVGDDAQSIYGFRGADYKNVHSFLDRVPGAVSLKLEKNYRSTQEILDVSNWLIAQSPLDYQKRLVAVRGSGIKPRLLTFRNEWEEATWIADDLVERRGAGAMWENHMILVRSGFAGRCVESALLAREIPYRFIGGQKLLESAHVRDVMSVLRLIGNPSDEIGWIRYLSLWNGIGERTAEGLFHRIQAKQNLEECIQVLERDWQVPKETADIISIVSELKHDVGKAFAKACLGMESVLFEKFKNQDWEKRKRDFELVEKLGS